MTKLKNYEEGFEVVEKQSTYKSKSIITGT